MEEIKRQRKRERKREERRKGDKVEAIVPSLEKGWTERERTWREGGDQLAFSGRRWTELFS